MRLKQLEVQGYKTFAAKTQFLFNGGLTAIVGPNGSGKSNVADAIQWVLGEQSYALLRAKRSEDMIFSGSNERARMGMAQASLTLDNADGWLPIDYGEVVLTRRAYRSGENEYYINGTRVRLRDITDLLGESGLAKRTYTMIGQGLIDQALSLRPGERRALIEEAAGIAGHQARRNTALRQLEETHHNLERVHDILQEIEPRLRYLKGQATRAEQRLQVQAELDAHLRIWYGFRWQQALDQVALHEQAEAAAQAAVDARQATLDTLVGAATELRQRHSQLRTDLGDWHRDSSHLHRQAEVAQRELAVGAERLRQLAERRAEMLRELEPLQEREQEQAAQVLAAEELLAAAQVELDAVNQTIAEAQSRLDDLEARRRRQAKTLGQAQQAVRELDQAMATQERRLLEQEGRKQALAEEETRLQGELAAAEAQLGQLTDQLDRHQAELSALEERGRALVERRQELLDAVAETEAELARQAQELARRQRTADRLRDQMDLLQRLKEEGEGFSGGTRAIVRALGAGTRLRGIVGTVADQLQVPAELELAVETALGGRLQDLIVERWQDAEAAIAWLKDNRGGRTTFLPLDTLRPAERLAVPRGPGVIGLAADLVTADPRLDVVVDYLLGRVVITRDLPTARRLLGDSGPRPTVVTLDGDIVRPGGSISGGSPAQARRQDQGVLARERALRELPQELAAAEQSLAELTATRNALEQEQQLRRRELAQQDDQLAALAREQQATGGALAKLQGQSTQFQREIEWRQERLARAAEERQGLADKDEQGRVRLAELAQQVQAAQETVAEADEALQALDSGNLVADLAQRRSAAGVVTARVNSHQAVLANEQRTLAQIQREIRYKQERAQALADEHQALEARLEARQVEETALGAEIDRFAALIDPAEAELAEVEAGRLRVAGEEAEQRQHMHREERALGQAQLALQRARDELEHLRHEIEHDVGLVEWEQGEQASGAPPLRPLVERLPTVDALPEGLEEELRELRAHYHRLGGVNPNAPEEYADALDRFEFLTTQSADLEEAARTLEKVVQELNEVMHRQFMATFKAVAAEFKEQFTTLFGGGTARLQLSEPDDPMESGIEIVVRPPGKRTQPLPLLSGGERSLTAAALILSILKVSPPPFCILDEVDAALDEANVDRFRAALREAAQQTQFLVITHNRGTIEVADTIYGVSMGSDSASQVLSLHLEERDGRRELVADEA